MYICMTWQKFILKKKTRKFMHIHIFDISPLDYFWTDCLIRFFFFVRNVCQKECFCFYPWTAGSLVNGVGHTKGEPSVEDLWKVFPHSPGDGVLRRHWEKDPMFTLKKRRRGFVIRHVGAWYRLPIKNLGLLLKIEFL